jgi:hypothetical protein
VPSLVFFERRMAWVERELGASLEKAGGPGTDGGLAV